MVSNHDFVRFCEISKFSHFCHFLKPMLATPALMFLSSKVIAMTWNLVCRLSKTQTLREKYREPKYMQKPKVMLQNVGPHNQFVYHRGRLQLVQPTPYYSYRAELYTLRVISYLRLGITKGFPDQRWSQITIS